MSKAKKDVAINITDPIDIDHHRFEGGFSLAITSMMNSNGRQKRINLTFERWWLPIIAKQLREILEEERSELDRLAQRCGFKE